MAGTASASMPMQAKNAMSTGPMWYAENALPAMFAHIGASGNKMGHAASPDAKNHPIRAKYSNGWRGRTTDLPKHVLRTTIFDCPVRQAGRSCQGFRGRPVAVSAINRFMLGLTSAKSKPSHCAGNRFVNKKRSSEARTPRPWNDTSSAEFKSGGQARLASRK